MKIAREYKQFLHHFKYGLYIDLCEHEISSEELPLVTINLTQPCASKCALILSLGWWDIVLGNLNQNKHSKVACFLPYN